MPQLCIPTALDALRSRTRLRHEILDSHLPIVRPGAGYPDYVQHIESLYGWLKPLNGRLWSLDWPAAIDAPRRAGKIALIENDLRLAASAGLGAPAGLRICPSVPRLAGLDAYAMGVAYVIEGSQLGGAVLARRFNAGAVQGAYSYLAGYADATGSMWRQFLAYLHETVATPEHIDQAIQGACDAFDTLTAWMAPLLACGHEQPGR